MQRFDDLVIVRIIRKPPPASMTRSRPSRLTSRMKCRVEFFWYSAAASAPLAGSVKNRRVRFCQQKRRIAAGVAHDFAARRVGVFLV